MTDADLRHCYLEAMGVRVWRLREEPVGTGAQPIDGLPDDPPPAPPVIESVSGTSVPAPSPHPDPSIAEPIGPPDRAAVGTMGWEDLRAAVAACQACSLWHARTQTVFGVGNRQADLMIIGEAPGADEDRQGEPFVGRAGQLLNLMLAAIGLGRGQVYIANILKCRPPGNRDPLPEETLRCQPFLLRQMALIRPRVLLSVGRISAQTLLRTDTAISRLRGRWYEFGPDRTPLMVTYHPAYLLRSPEQKGRAWQDLVEVARRLQQANAHGSAAS
jgi:uracil-DNA glycosylase family 4